MYKAYVIKNFFQNLEPIYKDEQANKDKIKVNVKACGICGRDVVIWKGGFKNLKLPVIPGHEIFGYHENKPVAIFPAISCGKCEYCLAGKENLCANLIFYGEGIDGGYAEIIYSPTENVIQLKDDNFEAYAASACPLATAIHASQIAEIKSSTRVLVTGAGGGVGIHAIQYLNHLNAYVIAQTSKNKVSYLKDFANEVISEPNFSNVIKNVDVVFELVGSLTINESLRVIKREGKIILIGNISGEELVLKRPALSIMREHRIIGSAAYTKKEYREALDLIHEQKIKPIYKEYSLDEVNIAIHDLLKGNVLGRAVLKIN
jgi:Zn-dependent alcohol dehydrogenases